MKEIKELSEGYEQQILRLGSRTKGWWAIKEHEMRELNSRGGSVGDLVDDDVNSSVSGNTNLRVEVTEINTDDTLAKERQRVNTFCDIPLPLPLPLTAMVQ